MMAPLLLEICKGTQNDGNQGDDCDRARAQNSPAAEAEITTALRASGAEKVLPKNWRKQSAEARKTFDQDQGECRDGESPRENTMHTFQLELDCETRESRNSSHRLLPRPLFNSRGPRRHCPIRENSLDRAMSKLENGLGGTLISTKKLERVLGKYKNGEGSLGQITADVVKALLPECLEKLARSLSVMCWDMNFPEEWLCSLTAVAPKVVGATCSSKFRPIAGLCAMRKFLGCVWLKSLFPQRYESVQAAFLPKTHADAGLFFLLQAAELSREWQR